MTEVTWAEFVSLRAKVYDLVERLTWDGNGTTDPDYDGGDVDG